MTSHFNKEFFINNRARLKKLVGGDYPIVITANGLLQRSADTTFQFRQDSNFWYLTGIELPDLILVIDTENEYLIVPKRSNSRETFDGSLDYQELTKLSGVKTIYDDNKGWECLSKSLKKTLHVATLSAPKSYIDAHGIYTNPAREHLINKLLSLRTNLETIDIRQHLSGMRMIKQPAEINAIQEAIDLTADTFTKIKNELSNFDYEHEIEATISYCFNTKGHIHAYAPIIASGLNACTLHYVANNSKLQKNNLTLIDVGAEVSLYAADITRTYAAVKPTKRQKNVWQAVIDVQEYSKQILKPGADIRTCEKLIENFMGEKLRELGLIKKITHEAVRQYYPHATSHYIGLDVHDAADYERNLEPGMVLTVEPGIYIPEESIGIRIEDNVIICDSGLRVMSEKLPRELY